MSRPSIDTLFEALRKMHARACGVESVVYMSIPADPERDADLLLGRALNELHALREVAAENERLRAQLAECRALVTR